MGKGLKGNRNPNWGGLSEKTKDKISKTKIRLYAEGKIVPWNRGKHYFEGEKNPFYGKHHTEETKKNLSELKRGTTHTHSEYTKRKIGNANSKIMKKLWQNPEYREMMIDIRKIKNSKTMKEKFKNPEYKTRLLKAMLGGLLKRPTSFEQKISDLCFKFNLPFIYKGNGGFLINFKNPDFVNEKDKIVIEVFYSWFKIRDYGSVENYKEFCRNKYEPAGWKVIFIDELDLNQDNWEEICLNKLLNNTG